MLIFIDTEFTHFHQPELISIGLVTEDESHEFYAELPVNTAKCSDFVIDIVLPQLSKDPNAQCTPAELNTRLLTWLEQFADQSPRVCYDYDGDWNLFCSALDDNVPAWIDQWNIDRLINPIRVWEYLKVNGLKEHHALNDAKANRHAFVPLRVRDE